MGTKAARNYKWAITGKHLRLQRHTHRVYAYISIRTHTLQQSVAAEFSLRSVPSTALNLWSPTSFNVHLWTTSHHNISESYNNNTPSPNTLMLACSKVTADRVNLQWLYSRAQHGLTSAKYSAASSTAMFLSLQLKVWNLSSQLLWKLGREGWGQERRGR